MKRGSIWLWAVGLILLLAALACSAAAADSTFSVSIQSPSDGALLPVDIPTTITIQSSDLAGPGVQYVELFVDGDSSWTSDQGLAPQGTLNAEVTWTPETEGDHTLMAIAYREDGTASPPTRVDVKVVALTPLDESGGGEANGDEATDEPAGEATAESSAEPAGDPPPGANAPVDTSGGVQARVDTGAFVRAGPGVFCEQIGGVEAGNTITVYELSQDGYWYKTDFLGPDRIGWVWIDLVTVTGDASLIHQGNVPGCIGCGDEVCNGAETCASCPGDCGECCGNGTCEGDYGETCFTCAADCGDCCGDHVCDEVYGETCDSCEEDCGDCCGNDVCDYDYGETMGNCPFDCAPHVIPCGDGFCDVDHGENADRCPVDCGPCGDGVCGYTETCITCAMDCPVCCGDGYCDRVTALDEDHTTCPEDCPDISSSSDRALKENITPVNSRAVLETLMSLPISRWSYIEDGGAVTHIGPMAQDFYGAYGLGDTDKAIYTVDSGGVSMAAIQGMYQIVQEQQAQIDALAARQARVERLVIPALAGVLVLVGGAFGAGVWVGRQRKK